MSFRRNLTAMSRCESNPEGGAHGTSSFLFPEEKNKLHKLKGYKLYKQAKLRPETIIFVLLLLVSVCDTPTADWAI